MGDEADYLIERELAEGYLLPPQRRYIPSDIPDFPHPPNCRCVTVNGINTHCTQDPHRGTTAHSAFCKCPGCMYSRMERLEHEHNMAAKKVERVNVCISVEQAFKKSEPYDTPTHIVCKRCQATGLHWGLKDGKPEMREEGGWPHKCKKIEGITLNLPNILDPQ